MGDVQGLSLSSSKHHFCMSELSHIATLAAKEAGMNIPVSLSQRPRSSIAKNAYTFVHSPKKCLFYRPVFINMSRFPS